MTSELATRFGDTLDALRDDRAGRRLQRDVALAVKVEHGRGLVKAARLDGQAYATRTAQANIAHLSADEAMWIQAAPLSEPRLKLVGDAYALYAAQEISR